MPTTMTSLNRDQPSMFFTLSGSCHLVVGQHPWVLIFKSVECDWITTSKQLSVELLALALKRVSAFCRVLLKSHKVKA